MPGGPDHFIKLLIVLRAFLQMEAEHRLFSLCAQRSCTPLLGKKITLTSNSNLRFETGGK